MNSAEAREMIDAVADGGASLYTAFCYRFSRSAEVRPKAGPRLQLGVAFGG